MRRSIGSVMMLLLSMPAWAADPEPAKTPPLTPKEIADGWILLWDRETTFGWNIEGNASVTLDMLLLGGEKATTMKTTTEFGDFILKFRYAGEAASESKLVLFGREYALRSVQDLGAKKGDWIHAEYTVERVGTTRRSVSRTYSVISILGLRTIRTGRGDESDYPVDEGAIRTSIDFRVPAGSRLGLRDIKLKPLGTKSIFNGKDLAGWKEFPGRKSKFRVNDRGELNVKDGPGDLQTEGQWADFILQLDCISNGKHLNSGVFFRCIPGEYQQGYESQIHNGFKEEDRTKPVDFGTGAIYRRQPARRVVPNDGEWFTKTIVVHGNHLAVWVNGIQVSDFTDTRPPSPNARNGSKLEKGPISLQGHDPTTDLSFRNFRIAELPNAAKK
jgi:hypothetical protein